jgi:2-oxoglutarate ferredoxin oxidoreductase subunit gamma
MSLEIEKVVIAGHVAQGIHVLGRILALAGMLENREVSWLPPYGPIIMAGHAAGTVILSTAEVASPVVEVPDALLALNSHAFERYNRRLKAGGMVLFDPSQVRVEESQIRDDVRSIGVPAAELGAGEPGLLTPALALLGAYVSCSKLVGLESVTDGLREVLREAGRPAPADLKTNRRILERGAAFVREKKYMFSRYRYSIFTG